MDFAGRSFDVLSATFRGNSRLETLGNENHKLWELQTAPTTPGQQQLEGGTRVGCSFSKQQIV